MQGAGTGAGAGAGGRVTHKCHSNAAYISNRDDVRAYTLALLW